MERLQRGFWLVRKWNRLAKWREKDAEGVWDGHDGVVEPIDCTCCAVGVIQTPWTLALREGSLSLGVLGQLIVKALAKS